MRKNERICHELGTKGYCEPFQTTPSGKESKGGNPVSGAPHHLSPVCRRKCEIIYLLVYGACSSVMGLLSSGSHLLFVSVLTESLQHWSFSCLLPSFCPRDVFWLQLRLRMTLWSHRYQTSEIASHKPKEFRFYW